VCLLGQAVADSVIAVVEEFTAVIIRCDQPVERVIDVVDCLAQDSIPSSTIPSKERNYLMG